jgi:hypothetical protein
MNHYARELIGQVIPILTMSFGLHSMEDMEIRSASWDNKLLTLEESKKQNVIMGRSLRERSSDHTANALRWIMSVISATSEVKMDNALKNTGTLRLKMDP